MLTIIKTHYQKLLISIITFIVGILCIIVGASSGKASAEAYENIGNVIGISLIVIGSIAVLAALILTILTRKNAIGLAGGSASLLAAGIFLTANNGICGELILYFVYFVPYFLLVAGILSVCEVLVTAILSIKKSSLKDILVTLIIGSIGGVIAIVIGALAIGNDPVISHNVQVIIFGVVLMLVALYIVLTTLFFSNVIATIFTTSESSEEHKDAIDAQTNEQ